MSEHIDPSKENEQSQIEEATQIESPEELTDETVAQPSEIISAKEDADAEELPPVLSPAQRVLKEIGSWVLCIVVAVAIALVLRNYVFTVVRVDGRSMCPTLQDNERLFSRIIGYTPERGDVIIFNPKSNPDVAYVKRVIATEGDRIWIDDATGEVHLKKSGSDKWEILEEDYIAYEAVPECGIPDGKYNSRTANIAQRYSDDSGEEGLLIEKDHIFVMGDNRNHSNDSRNGSAVGQVHVDSVIGVASFRWWPLSEFGWVD